MSNKINLTEDQITFITENYLTLSMVEMSKILNVKVRAISYYVKTRIKKISYSKPIRKGKNGQKSSYNKKYSTYKAVAKKRGLCFELTKEEFINITTQNCIYCGSEPITVNPTQYRSERRSKELIELGNIKFNGIDRVDNKVGYILDNSKPCCATCNRMKNDLDVNYFLNHINKIAKKENN